MSEPSSTEDLSSLLAEAFAGHFPRARQQGEHVGLGFGGVEATCRVTATVDRGAFTTAHLSFLLSGGRLGPRPVEACLVGYGSSPREAVISGCCTWTCSFGALLRAAFTDEAPDAVVQVTEVELHGQRWRVFFDGYDRMLTSGGRQSEGDEGEARARLCGEEAWLLSRVLASGTLPLLAPDTPVVLSVFCSDGSSGRRLEVKAQGVDWPAAEGLFAGAPPSPPDRVTMLREHAVLVPIGPAPALDRGSIERTVRGLDRPFASGDRRRASDWTGWRPDLAPPLAASDVAALEAELGPLPEAYRCFLLEVAESGAGPGYGLLSPRLAGQRTFTAGDFPWTAPDRQPTQPIRGALVLACAGCSMSWLLVLRGPHRGEVWIDAQGSDGGVRPAAPSFDAWYREWLDACVRDVFPWLQWSSACCATPHALSSYLNQQEAAGLTTEVALERLRADVGPGAITVASGGDGIFGAGQSVDPCAGCVSLTRSLGLADTVYAPGVAPLETV